MQYGFQIFATVESIQPDELGREVETRGFDTLLFSEHTHIPVNFLQTTERGQSLPDYYWQAYDPFVAATVAASATTTLRVGTGISLILQHDPITLAKQVATIDQVSSGRFVLGIGSGWIPEAMNNHGISYRTRYRFIREHVTAMKKIWTEDEPEFRGEFINFSKIKSYPKPVQAPHPPLVSGGSIGPKSLDFIASHCDGWMPILGIPDWPKLKEGIRNLHKHCNALGRHPDTIELSIFAWSLPEQEIIDDMQTSGISRIIISLAAKEREAALLLLDQCTALSRE